MAERGSKLMGLQSEQQSNRGRHLEHRARLKLAVEFFALYRLVIRTGLGECVIYTMVILVESEGRMTQTILTVVGIFALEVVVVWMILFFALRQISKEIAEEEEKAREE